MKFAKRLMPLAVLAMTLSLILVTALFHGPVRSVTAKEGVVAPVLQEESMPNRFPGGTFGFGRPATEEEIAAWDTNVFPDGTGLPEGSGTVAEGAELYAMHCAHCHSVDGRESAYLMPFRTLVGEYDADAWPQGPLTVGNYWPYATSLFDLIRRGMPYDTPGILSDDEVYALVAWLLHENGIVDEDAVMDASSILEVEMPALQHYVPHDPRDTFPYQ